MKKNNNAWSLPILIIVVTLTCCGLLVLISNSGDKSETQAESTPTEQIGTTQGSKAASASEPTPDPEPEPAPEQESSAQVFENDFAKAEFKGVQDMNPYFYVNFMVTNKLGQNIVITPSDFVVNDSVNVKANGGSSILEPIQPGNSGYASLSVAYEFAGVSGVDEVRSVTGTLVINDESLHEIASLPFSVVI